ncbi:MAG: glycosyltransferase [Pirellulaceae bacterium]|nr:glycosyltransferase [Pirellulaceae bacterium]
MPRRVLFMISSMRGGGSEQQTLLLLKHLDRARFQPHLYLTDKVGQLLGQVPEDVTIHSFSDRNRKAGIYFPGRILRQQIAHLRDVITREKIEAIYDRTFHMTMIAGPATADSGIPRVSTIVSPPDRALPLVESRFVWLKRRRLAHAYQQSRTVVAVSRQAARSAQTYYSLRPDSVSVIMNPVDERAIHEAASRDRPERDDRVTLVCVARMTSEKGHADLIDALALTEKHWDSDAPVLNVWLIGDGPLRQSLQSRCRQTIHRHDVQFLGASTNPAPAIASADALILPSQFEGMPNVVLEAMALGTPVIATRAGGTVELQRDEPTMLLADACDPESLADAILKFVDQRDLARHYAETATRMIQTHHAVGPTIEKIQRLLE